MALETKTAAVSSHEPSIEPFIPASAQMREFTPRALILGTLLGMVFGASSLYLVLKVGLTVSASIPVAVISAIAFGVGVTMPAILILGFDLEIARVTLVAALGAWLGIRMMIPLRRA